MRRAFGSMGLGICIMSATFVVGVLACGAWAQDAATGKGSVSSAKEARRIGEAVLIRKFGEEIQMERPFKVKLENGVWSVVGTRHCQEALPRPDLVCYGGHWVRIAKMDGRIVGIGGNDPMPGASAPAPEKR